MMAPLGTTLRSTHDITPRTVPVGACARGCYARQATGGRPSGQPEVTSQVPTRGTLGSVLIRGASGATRHVGPLVFDCNANPDRARRHPSVREFVQEWRAAVSDS